MASGVEKYRESSVFSHFLYQGKRVCYDGTMSSSKVKKVCTYAGGVLCSLGIIMAVPLIIHPGTSHTPVAPSDTATVVSFTTGNANPSVPKETCTIVYRMDGNLVPITETPAYCAGIKVGDTVKF